MDSPQRTWLARLCRGLGFACVWLVVAFAQAAEQRVALVIGNSRYASAPLKNPGNDATAMARVLKEQLAFDQVDLVLDADEDRMKRALAAFGRQLAATGALGFFYYSGHGVSVNGRNFLLPVGHDFRTEEDVDLYAVDARKLLDQMENAGNPLNIVVLDACRDFPLQRRTRGAARGLARIDAAPAGSLIAFSTAAGATADDNPAEANGLYTKHLLKRLQAQPARRIEDVFQGAAVDVAAASGRKQRPELLITGIDPDRPVYLAAARPSIVVPPLASPVQAVRIGFDRGWGAKLPISSAVLRGMRMAVDDLNARGVLIGGRKAGFEVKEAGLRAPAAADVKDVDCSVGGVDGVVALQFDAVKARAASRFDGCGRAVTFLVHSAEYRGKEVRLEADGSKRAAGLAQWGTGSLGARRWAIFAAVAIDAPAARAFRAAVEAHGGTVVAAEAGLSSTTPGLAPTLTKLKAASPDALFAEGPVNTALLGEMDRLGMARVRVFFDGSTDCEPPPGGNAPDSRQPNPALLDRAICVSIAPAASMAEIAWLLKLNMAYPDASGQTDASRSLAAYAYDATMVLADAMQRANSIDPAVYVARLFDTEYRGVTAVVQFDGDGARRDPPLSFYAYENGKPRRLK